MQIQKLEKNSNDSLSYLKGAVNGESEVVVQKCVEKLQSDEFMEQLCEWTAEELPKEEKKKVGD